MTEKKTYGVSFGNGNDGVSQLYPNFIVTTDRPFALAKLAMLHRFNNGNSVRWAKRVMDIDGESEYTIYATIYDPSDSPGWSEHNGAWMICQVFPVDQDLIDNSTAREYDSLEDVFGKSFVKRHAADERE